MQNKLHSIIGSADTQQRPICVFCRPYADYLLLQQISSFNHSKFCLQNHFMFVFNFCSQNHFTTYYEMRALKWYCKWDFYCGYSLTYEGIRAHVGYVVLSWVRNACAVHEWEIISIISECTFLVLTYGGNETFYRGQSCFLALENIRIKFDHEYKLPWYIVMRVLTEALSLFYQFQHWYDGGIQRNINSEKGSKCTPDVTRVPLQRNWYRKNQTWVWYQHFLTK